MSHIWLNPMCTQFSAILGAFHTQGSTHWLSLKTIYASPMRMDLPRLACCCPQAVNSQELWAGWLLRCWFAGLVTFDWPAGKSPILFTVWVTDRHTVRLLTSICRWGKTGMVSQPFFPVSSSSFSIFQLPSESIVFGSPVTRPEKNH